MRMQFWGMGGDFTGIRVGAATDGVYVGAEWGSRMKLNVNGEGELMVCDPDKGDKGDEKWVKWNDVCEKLREIRRGL